MKPWRNGDGRFLPGNVHEIHGNKILENRFGDRAHLKQEGQKACLPWKMRKPRILLPGAFYHVTARTHRSEMLFEPVTTKALFLEIVARAKKKFRFQVKNFCLMENHFHMIIRPEAGENLSAILQWILSVFAMSWNRRNGLVGQGAVWAQRFFSKALVTLGQYLRASHYVDQNPVVAGLVNNPEDWAYGAAGMKKQGLSWLVEASP